MFCYIAYIKGVLANFVLKFPNFRYRGNKGHSLVNLNVAIKLHDLEKNRARCNMFCYMSYINGVLSNFVLKFPNFRYHGNKGRSFVNFNETVKLRAHENPLLDATLLAIALT